jgi:hypothetical protein
MTATAPQPLPVSAILLNFASRGPMVPYSYEILWWALRERSRLIGGAAPDGLGGFETFPRKSKFRKDIRFKSGLESREHHMSGRSAAW